MEYEENQMRRGKWSTPKIVTTSVIAVVILILVLASFPFVTINAGERGVVLRLGKIDRVLEAGFHWRTPFIEDVKIMDVRTQKIEVEADAASKDLQTVTTTIALNYNLDPQFVGDIWRELQNDYDARIVHPAIQEAVKAATATYTAEELITNRAAVREQILVVLRERMSEKHIIASNVSIVNFSFSAKFNAAIEAKVTAEQRALEAENKLKQVEFEAEQKIATARAEAESVRLQAQALKENVRFLELKELEVRLEMARRWDGKLPVNVYGSAPIPFIDVNNL